ncbi:MAG: hypothetical protein ACRD3P_00780 [Terriglobales bacterium]
MSSFPAPNIAEVAGEIGGAPQQGYNEYQRGQALRQQTALQRQQTQQVGLENQQKQLDLKNQQIISQVAPDHVVKDQSGKVTGYDWNGLAQDALQKGASPQYVNSMQANYAKVRSDLANATKTEQENENAANQKAIGMHEDLKQITDPQQRQQAYGQMLGFMKGHGLDVSNYPQQAPQNNDDLTHLEVPLGMHAQLLNDHKTQSETDANNAKAANENAQAALANIKVNMAKNSKPGDFDSQIDQIFDPKQNAGGNKMAKAMVNGALSRGDFEGAKQVLDQAYQSQQEMQKYKAEQTDPEIMRAKAQQEAMNARATQGYKIEQSKVEGQTRQLIQGMTEPVYAYVPQAGGPPQKTLMSKTDALQSGIKTMLPVTEKEVSEDTMLLNRLGDVHQKIARYEQAMQKGIGVNDRLAIQSLLSTDKFKLGAFGAEIPVDSFNKVADQLHVKSLSPSGRDALIAYYNAREALVGYNRVLSGSGKSSDKALELQEQTLPDVATADQDMASRGFRDFKENLNVVGQGLPKIPGVKSPEEWERQSGPRSANPRSFPTSVSGAGYLNSLLGGQ